MYREIREGIYFVHDTFLPKHLKLHTRPIFYALYLDLGRVARVLTKKI